MSSLDIRSVGKSFPGTDRVAALDDVSLAVREGEMIAILGPSGCGKTTLLRCVAGLERPDRGSIVLDGTPVSGPGCWVPPERRGLGMVFQSYALWPHLSVTDNLAFPLRMRGRRRADIAVDIAEALATVGLAGKGQRLPSQLSGGQQQRVALARAIIANPKLLLFDEPLSNLDVNLRELMRTELRALKQSLGWTGLYVTHDRAEAVHLADRIVVLRDGRIQQTGTGAELYSRPVNLFVAEFMGDVNTIPAGTPAFERLRARLAADEGAIAFRPESLRLLAASGDAPAGAWRGRIKLATDLGWHMEYVVAADGVDLKVRGATAAPFGLNDAVDVVPDFDQAMRFPGVAAPSGESHAQEADAAGGKMVVQ